jgi:2-methylcitrate dehydratase PrpD
VTVALRKRVRIERVESIGRVQSRIAIQLKDGRKLERYVEHALGTLERPMSDSDLEAKFRGLADGILTDKQADEVIRLCWAVESLPDAGAIARDAAI